MEMARRARPRSQRARTETHMPHTPRACGDESATPPHHRSIVPNNRFRHYSHVDCHRRGTSRCRCGLDRCGMFAARNDTTSPCSHESAAAAAQRSLTSSTTDFARTPSIDQREWSAHPCSGERAQIGIEPPRLTADARLHPAGLSHPGAMFHMATNKASRACEVDLESFEHGICCLKAACGCSDRALKSPIGPIGTSIPKTYGVCEHRDNGFEPSASRRQLGVAGVLT